MEAGEERTRVVLELAKGEPVTGSLLAGDCPPRSFTGWMELVAALQAALDGIPHPPQRASGKSQGKSQGPTLMTFPSRGRSFDEAGLPSQPEAD
jgi:hypothetical protein